jgi:hypothetical protein
VVAARVGAEVGPPRVDHPVPDQVEGGAGEGLAIFFVCIYYLLIYKNFYKINYFI